MLNMDFSRSVVLNTTNMEWTASPMAGVWRKPLAREEAERGHATSVVRYEPGAKFSSHGHPLGEEILVLEGTFSDETGDYSAGTYFRNPPGFSHAPFSDEGCVILVKLHQFQAGDHQRVVIDTHSASWDSLESSQKLHLHCHGREKVELLKWSKDSDTYFHALPESAEMYVVQGELRRLDQTYPAGTWMRSARVVWEDFNAQAGSLVWLKSGHLE